MPGSYTKTLEELRADIKVITKLLLGGDGIDAIGLCEFVRRNKEGVEKIGEVVSTNATLVNKLIEEMRQHVHAQEILETKVFRHLAEIKKKIDILDNINWFLDFLSWKNTNPKMFWFIIIMLIIIVRVCL